MFQGPPPTALRCPSFRPGSVGVGAPAGAATLPEGLVPIRREAPPFHVPLSQSVMGPLLPTVPLRLAGVSGSRHGPRSQSSGGEVCRVWGLTSLFTPFLLNTSTCYHPVLNFFQGQQCRFCLRVCAHNLPYMIGGLLPTLCQTFRSSEPFHAPPRT